MTARKTLPKFVELNTFTDVQIARLLKQCSGLRLSLTNEQSARKPGDSRRKVASTPPPKGRKVAKGNGKAAKWSSKHGREDAGFWVTHNGANVRTATSTDSAAYWVGAISAALETGARGAYVAKKTRITADQLGGGAGKVAFVAM